MKKSSTIRILLALILAVATIAGAQQPAKKDRSGNQVCVVRSDATAPVTIEYRSSSEWQQVKLDPGKDATITADHIRVATTREDRAVVTVDLPTQAGKKYRLFWNPQTSIWDFSPVL
jgi:hypothetical protein